MSEVDQYMVQFDVRSLCESESCTKFLSTTSTGKFHLNMPEHPSNIHSLYDLYV